jgi:hypothetical protein
MYSSSPLPNGHTYLSWKGSVDFAARICAERGAERCGVFLAVRHESPFKTRRERCADFLRSFTLDAVSQLERDTSTALATIREWKNSFVLINRIPLDILSLIPTHLSSQADRFRATFVCHHWRKVFLQHGALWAQLFLRKGETYVTTLLERAKGSPLDVFTHHEAPVGAVTLLYPHVRQIERLEFVNSSWVDVTTFSEVDSGPLPLLRALTISTVLIFNPLGQANAVVPPSSPFFRGAINLEQFTIRMERFQPLSRFIFPNLTTFELSVWPDEVEFSVPDLLDFLKASPMLRTVDLTISGGTTLEGIPREMVVILPSVTTFSLSGFEGSHVYDIAARISCPRADSTLLIHGVSSDNVLPNLDMFPASASLNAIVHQYTRSPVEGVTLEIKPLLHGDVLTSSLTFQSSDMTLVHLCFAVSGPAEDEDEPPIPFEGISCEVFSQAYRTIRDHPLLSHVKRLHVKYRAIIADTVQMVPMANEVGRLFGSLGPLDELTLDGCDLHICPYLPWKGPVAFAARLCPERGAEACGVFSGRTSRKIILDSLKVRHADPSCSFTLDAVSQLERDASTALQPSASGRTHSFHQPHPVGYPFPHPHPSHFPGRPFPCDFCVSSLAQSLPPTWCIMVPVIPQKRARST